MPAFGSPSDWGRHARLAQLSPVEAARALLRGEFGAGDEPALGFAMRRDPRILLDDDAILDAFFDLIGEVDDETAEPTDHVSPEAFLDRLAAASRR